MSPKVSLVITLLTLSSLSAQTQHTLQDPDRLPSPPMGFNNWSRFMCELNETLFVETADTMVSSGLLAAGYKWLNLDDCWMTHERTSNRTLQWDAHKFPRGLPWLTDYAHSQGFKVGIYADAGTETCGGYPGSLGFEAVDAATFAQWGMEYVKLDGCHVEVAKGNNLEETYRALYGTWHEVLAGGPSRMVFSVSAPAYFANDRNRSDWYAVMEWVSGGVGDLARHSTDILVYEGNGSAWDSIMVNYRYNTLLARYQRRGFYNDPDFLIPDHPRLSLDEKKSQFALWAAFSAPLIISANIPALGVEERAFLRNPDIIAVDQDPVAEQATLASRDDFVDVLTKSLANGRRVATVLNRGDVVVKRNISFAWLGLDPGCEYRVRDLWHGSEEMARGSLSVEVESHATAMFTFAAAEERCKTVATGIVFNAASERCLTGDPAAGVRFDTCRGREDQIWQIRQDGELRIG